MYGVEPPKPLPKFALPVILALSGLLVLPISASAQPPERGAAGSAVEMNDLERAFRDQMADVVLTGRFTTDGGGGKAEPEQYHIVSATKTGKDQWLILAKITYAKAKTNQSPAIPIPVKVLWAGDTPMISLTGLTIPGFGTFTSRVMFYGDRYAGTWQHDEVGGHLFGTLSKADQVTPPASE